MKFVSAVRVVERDIAVDDEMKIEMIVKWFDLNVQTDQCEFISIRDIRRDLSEHVSAWIDDEWSLNS